MTSKYWATAGMVLTFLIGVLIFAFAAQSTKAAQLTRVTPETQISLADICPH